MQSRTSFFNKTIFKKNLSRTWVVGLVYFFILLMGVTINYALSVANLTATDMETGYTAGYFLLNTLSCLSTGTYPVIFAIIAFMLTFSYLYSKRDSFMMHSFPVSRTSLYWTGIISSIVVLSIPVVVVAILTTAVAAATGASYIAAIWYWALIELAANVIFAGIAMIAMMITGQAVTAVVFYAIFNALYYMMELVLRLLAASLMFGMSGAMDEITINMFSPAAYINQNCGVGLELKWDDDFARITGLDVTLKGGKELIIYLIVGIIMILAGYLLYRTKKLETVSDFISVDAVKPIFSVGVSFFVSVVLAILTTGFFTSIFGGSYGIAYAICIVAMLVYGAICYYVTLMLIAKTMRVFKRRNAIAIATYSVCALAVMMGARIDILGIESRIPDTNDIAWAGIMQDNTFVFKDQESIEQVRNIHRMIIADRTEMRNMPYETTEDDTVAANSLCIKYMLKNGKTLYRTYVVRDYDMVGSDQYHEVIQTSLNLMNNPQVIKEHLLGSFYDSCDVTELDFTIPEWDEEGEYYSCNSSMVSYDTLDAQAAAYKDIYSAVLKDIDEGKILQTDFDLSTDQQLYNDFNIDLKDTSKRGYIMDGDIWWGYGETTYENYMYIPLTRDCTNTLAKLKEYGYYTDDSQLLTYLEVSDREIVY